MSDKCGMSGARGLTGDNWHLSNIKSSHPIVQIYFQELHWSLKIKYIRLLSLELISFMYTYREFIILFI